nr:hypothetical protein [Tanacetum cinerariifolium]
VLRDGEACQRCTCTRCGSGLSKGLCYICGNNQNSSNDSLSISANSSQNPPQIDECCCECGNALNGIFCQQCTCKSCGKGAHTGYNCPPKTLIISNLEPCNQTMNNELPQTLPGFDPTCYSDKENSCQPTNEDYYHEQNSCYNSNSFGPDHCQPSQYTVDHPIFNAHNDFLNSLNELSIAQNTIMEQMTTLTSICEMVCQIFQKKQEEKRIEEEQVANARYWKIPACCDDDDDYDFAITPVLSTEEPDNSLSMGDEHLDTISATESDEVIKSSVENLVPIPSEFEGIHDTMCDEHLVNNPTPLGAKDHFEIVTKSNDDISFSDDDSLYNKNIEYVEASPHDSKVVSLEVAEIVIPEEEEIEDDNLREKLLNVHLLIANIEELKENPTPSSKSLTKSYSTSPKSFLEETNTFHNSLPEFENFYFDLEEISSDSTTTHSDISLSEYDSFIFDFTHEEFVDKLAHIISPPDYDCFYFWDFLDPGELMSILNSGIRENFSTTCVNLPIEDDHSLLLAYVVWIFLAYLTYPVIPPYLHSFGNEDTIFDPGITINRIYSFKPVWGNRVKHRDLKQALRGRHPMLISNLILLFSS